MNININKYECIYHPPNIDISITKYEYIPPTKYKYNYNQIWIYTTQPKYKYPNMNTNTKCKNLHPTDKCFSGWGGERDQTSEVGFEIHIILKIILRNILSPIMIWQLIENFQVPKCPIDSLRPPGGSLYCPGIVFIFVSIYLHRLGLKSFWMFPGLADRGDRR